MLKLFFYRDFFYGNNFFHIFFIFCYLLHYKTEKKGKSPPIFQSYLRKLKMDIFNNVQFQKNCQICKKKIVTMDFYLFLSLRRKLTKKIIYFILFFLYYNN